MSSTIEKLYGPPNTNQVYANLPYPMVLSWDTDTKIKRFLCHSKIKDKVETIFTQTLKHYTMEGVLNLRLNIFGGCLNVRPMRGGTSLSMHSYGLAIDIDPLNNQLKWGRDKAKLAGREYNKFWEIVEKNGGYSLGRLKNYDWMHFQFVKP